MVQRIGTTFHSNNRILSGWPNHISYSHFYCPKGNTVLFNIKINSLKIATHVDSPARHEKLAAFFNVPVTLRHCWHQLTIRQQHRTKKCTEKVLRLRRLQLLPQNDRAKKKRRCRRLGTQACRKTRQNLGGFNQQESRFHIKKINVTSLHTRFPGDNENGDGGQWSWFSKSLQ